MQVAFVSQPSDKVLPPIQTSVGAMTHGLARGLAADHDVRVYGVRDLQRAGQVPTTMVEDGVSYHFFDSTPVDRFLGRHIWKITRVEAPLNRGMRPPPSASAWQAPHYGRQVAKALARDRPDVVIIETCAQYAPVIKARCRDSKIILILGAELFPQCPRREMIRRFESVDLVVGVSDYITQKTRDDFPSVANRCETVHCAIDADDFHVVKDHARSRSRTIMYAGGVSPHKGVHVLVSALDAVAESLPDVHLDIVGPPGSYPISENYPLDDHRRLAEIAPLYAQDYQEYLRSLLTDRTRPLVDFVGQVPRSELVERYAQADVFCFPSIWTEGCGIPPLEAMASGVPVVASRAGALGETVQDGITGVLFPMGDDRALSEALVRLLSDNDLRARRGEAGRARILEHFTYAEKAALLAGHIERLAGGSSPKRSVTSGAIAAGDE